ncbi:MAG: SpoIIE family protein phosphatase [Steroidobacteraceae bacterium]
MEMTVEIPAPRQSRHLIDEASKIGDARREAARMAQLQELPAEVAGRVAIVATELANNLLQHGGGGELLLQSVEADDACLVEIMAVDRGRGMSHSDRCLADGFSTGGTMGTGLGAVRRLSSEFDLYSTPEQGTVVMARVGVGTIPHLGAVNIAVKGEIECGDSWRLARSAGATALLVVDGLGHGTFAAQAAQAALAAFDRSPFDPPQLIMERLHRALAGTRGAAAACACIDSSGRLSYAGVGNIHGALLSADGTCGLVSHNGTLGVRVARMHQFEYQRPKGALLLMNSDGVSARWSLAARPGLLQRHPAVVAGVLYRDHARAHDDATLVALH